VRRSARQARGPMGHHRRSTARPSSTYAHCVFENMVASVPPVFEKLFKLGPFTPIALGVSRNGN